MSPSAARVVIPLVYVAGLLLPPSVWAAEVRYVIEPVAELKVHQLPRGPLYWRVEIFPTLDQAKAAASKYRWNPETVSYDGWRSMTAEVAGKAWLFTLGQKAAPTRGATKVAEIGPVPPLSASEFLLRVNHGSGPPHAKTPVHSHFGSEAFYIIAGKLGQRTPHGVSYVATGHTLNGRMAAMPMEVFNAGTTDLNALVMFVVDADKPFSVPAELPEAD